MPVNVESMPPLSILTLVVAGLVFGCGPHPRDLGTTSDSGVDADAVVTPDGGDPVAECQKIDFLFVIDNSGSMAGEQANLIENFPNFIAAIDSYVTASGQPLDYRIGVTTTGRDLSYTVVTPDTSLPVNVMGDDGELHRTCGLPRPWIEGTDADPSGTFSCLGAVGENGPGIEMPLYMTKLALDDRLDDGINAGFLRDDALLAVVIITDEDDCSREDNNFDVSFLPDNTLDCSAAWPVADYVAALDRIKFERGRWAVAVLAGETDCESQFGTAAEAVRLKDFVTLVGDHATFGSICAGDLASPLQAAMATFLGACQDFPVIE